MKVAGECVPLSQPPPLTLEVTENLVPLTPGQDL